jgi:hypothetical protein
MSDSEDRADRIEELLAQNPRADKEQFEEAQEALERLRREGISGPSYRIISPYERRRLRVATRTRGTT